MNELLSFLKNKIAAFRRIEYLLRSQDVLRTKDVNRVKDMILSGDEEGIASWLAEHASELDVGEMTIRQLRLVAAKYLVPEYGTMSKQELVSHISIKLGTQHASRPRPSDSTSRRDDGTVSKGKSLTEVGRTAEG